MTKLEKEALLTLAKRIHLLASLENASFHADGEKDKQIKKSISPYMMWFESVAFDIEKIVVEGKNSLNYNDIFDNICFTLPKKCFKKIETLSKLQHQNIGSRLLNRINHVYITTFCKELFCHRFIF